MLFQVGQNVDYGDQAENTKQMHNGYQNLAQTTIARELSETIRVKGK